ncbi:MAG: glycogen synthase GlgA [Chloroflexi bacterium]|nr:glycogen synthase GlgA [Chloroflexota bacterium]
MSLKVLFVASEVAPYAKVGGLADVAGALPKALTALGHDVRLMMPRYSSIDEQRYPLSVAVDTFPVELDSAREFALLKETRLEGVPVYLLENGRYFQRENVYGYQDDLERFTFFCRAVPEAVRHLGWRPDVVHTNDWHTALVAAWLGTSLRADPFFGPTASVVTIHNLAFQGWFDEYFRARFNVVPRGLADQTVDGVSLYNALALAILHADVVNTVSETYAQEILTPAYGEHLDPLLRRRQDHLFGIINGIDYDFFNPATDRFIAQRYDASSLEKKSANKQALQQETGLAVDPRVPLIGVIGRLTDQKGFDLVAQMITPVLEERPFQLVLLGTGDERYHRLFRELAERHRDQAAVYLKFDAALAQRIYAGADMFLMPSRFEPCGLGQLISLRYGTLPVVRATGGLADTVQDYDPEAQTGTGFVFRAYNPFALTIAFARALEAYHQPATWRGLMARAMARDVSWSASARRYQELYEKAIALHR